MKLKRVFSDRNFKNVKFEDNFNVVFAEISDKTKEKNTHNLGKTSLLIVIDFLLLSTFTKRTPILNDPEFNGQTFYLELLLNSGKFLVIKRSLSKPSKVAFKCNDEELHSFNPPEIWDEENVPFEEAQKKLESFLGFDVLTKWSYRMPISYFLRTQKDYLDVFQLSKFKGKHLTWKPFVFELLGFDGLLVKEKMDNDEIQKKRKEEIEQIQQQLHFNFCEKDKIIGLIEIKTREKEKIEEKVDKFDFYIRDKRTTEVLTEKFDAELSNLKAEQYYLSRDIKKINDILNENRAVIKVEKLRELYTEVELYFPKEIEKKFEELEQFSEKISAERKKHLSENLENLKQQYKNVDELIKKKESEKGKVISTLVENSVFDKFKLCQKELNSIDVEITSLQEKLKVIESFPPIDLDVKKQNENLVSLIQKAIDGRAHSELNYIFNQLISEIIGTNAVISVQLNAENNVEFDADYQGTARTLTSEANGMSYKKLLCAAFDIALLIYYSKHSFFRFVYHDGIMEGLDDRIKRKLLQTTQKVCEENNLQYVLTIIDSDLPLDEAGKPIEISNECVCLRLNDKDDNGKLFMRSF